jgi:hypothetical protein
MAALAVAALTPERASAQRFRTYYGPAYYPTYYYTTPSYYYTTSSYSYTTPAYYYAPTYSSYYYSPSMVTTATYTYTPYTYTPYAYTGYTYTPVYSSYYWPRLYYTYP